MQIISKYYPGLSREQIFRFEKLNSIYPGLNKIFRIFPRREMDAFYEEHILHSMSISKVVNFKPGSKILDVGTGGGFPGIPLAILFPSCSFTLVDSMQKRIQAVKFIIQTLDLKNAAAIRVKIEDDFDQYDFVISRAVAAFPTLVNMVMKNISCISKNSRPNGLIYLKSGSFEDEICDFKKDLELFEISRFFNERSFQSKKMIYLPVQNFYFGIQKDSAKNNYC